MKRGEKDGKKLIAAIVIIAVIAVTAGCLYSIYSSEPVSYRPSCCFSNRLFMSEGKKSEVDISGMEFIGRINSCIGGSNIPKRNFECNYPNMLGAEIYRDKKDIFYLKYTDGDVVKLEGSRIYGEEVTILN